MPIGDFVGWTAATLMVATFSCRDALWMRRLAVCTNLAFIAYGLLASLAPVLALHTLLLPINVWRYWQCTHTRPTREPAPDQPTKPSACSPGLGEGYLTLVRDVCPGFAPAGSFVNGRLKEGGRK